MPRRENRTELQRRLRPEVGLGDREPTSGRGFLFNLWVIRTPAECADGMARSAPSSEYPIYGDALAVRSDRAAVAGFENDRWCP